jgi:NitT/TauT family transport system substrate-binding protein
LLGTVLMVNIGCPSADKTTSAPPVPSTASPAKLTKVRFGISPFQDTLLPILGSDRFKGWYKEEGLDVEFKILGWTEVQESLAAGQTDVVINNISSIIATHNKRPDFVYWYGCNTFDNGFALMIRPNSKLRTVSDLEKQLGNHESAVVASAKQLKGKTVITTSNTDMEQGVAAAARKAGLDFRKDIKIINLPPDEGLAAFLSGAGDAYIGGIPQRTRAGKEGMKEMLGGIDLGPAPINGFVTTSSYAKNNQETLLKLLKVWFKIVNYVDKNQDDGGKMISDVLNENSGAKFTVEDFKKFWQKYEHYPLTPQEVENGILSPKGRNYWRARWDDCNTYFFGVVKAVPQPVKPEGVFLMREAQDSYVAKYGQGVPK